jgi:hypothetical protein
MNMRLTSIPIEPHASEQEQELVDADDVYQPEARTDSEEDSPKWSLPIQSSMF